MSTDAYITQPVAIRIKNFENTPPNFIYNILMVDLRSTFKIGERQREQLANGLKYYLVALHYKLLVPQDVAKKKLETLYKDYCNIKSALPSFQVQVQEYERKCAEAHIGEPLVASTGLILYATRDYWWTVAETQIRSEEKPEYLRIIQKSYVLHNTSDYESEDLDATVNNTIISDLKEEKECIVEVMMEQESAYGCSLSGLKDLKGQESQLLKTIQEFEILFRIPEDQRYLQPVDEDESS